jgi:hypothetical protein
LIFAFTRSYSALFVGTFAMGYLPDNEDSAASKADQTGATKSVTHCVRQWRNNSGNEQYR